MADSTARPADTYLIGGVRYDSTKDMVEGVSGARAKIKTIEGTSYSVTSDDHGWVLDFTNAAAVTVTVPSGLRPDLVVGISQGGTGQVTVTAGSGTTLVSADGTYKTEKRYVMLSLTAFAQDTFRLFGRTAA
jgi:hypothetical protein